MRAQLDNMRAFVFSEEADGKINKETAIELIRIIDELLAST